MVEVLGLVTIPDDRIIVGLTRVSALGTMVAGVLRLRGSSLLVTVDIPLVSIRVALTSF